MNLLETLMAATELSPAAVKSSPAAARRVIEPECREALPMLSQVLSRLADVKRPVVQVTACSARCGPNQVAFELAAVAARYFGSTLLVSASELCVPDGTGARDLSWRMTRLLGGEPDAVTPDGVVTGLYHAQPPLDDAHGAQAASLKSWMAAPQDFRMVVFDSPAVAVCPQTLGAAVLCHACVLTLTAGRTRVDELQATERQLTNAGVRVVGTVLHSAPVLGLRWPRLATRH